MSFDDFGLDVTLERVISQIKVNSEMNFHLEIKGEKKTTFFRTFPDAG
jgi:signal transduction histidine kinase